MSLSVITLTPTTGQPPAGLFVGLHGWGSNAEDLASLAPYLNLPTYQFCFPNAPLPHPHAPGGFMWYDLNTQAGLPESRQLLLDWLQALAIETQVPLERMILAGFSQGGAMTLDIGARLPLAGLICLSGYLHPSIAALLHPNTPPVLLVHGQNDPVVPLKAAQTTDQVLRQAGVSVQYQEFPMAHEINPQALELVQDFAASITP
ncbi:dienelactone hydrolase family protein [Acaryochloris sp. 'Moss Beach']|uniref:alpha/beta hydrolase n=1 Tax=Acaryochloris sp. 'Moss Beach' TaxID=2740837 RepID=UPI001F16F804|nr:dienelactone hydrolase family protein [Acaryochloris sp. 'Moss Beach']UJB69479.1 dienelactone hydrolase family protein [Acaryochloris sp. 'Moss Beach']